MDTAPVNGDSAAHDPTPALIPELAQELTQEPTPELTQPAVPAVLSERELRLLAFERQWFRYAGAKEQAIRETFDISATRYYQLLGELIDRPEAMEHDPMLVKRLRRLRSARQRDRAARRMGMKP